MIPTPENAAKDHPEIALSVVVKHPVDDKILLLQSEHWENQYRIPRGHLLLGEALEEAVRRIVRTEVGIDCIHIDLISYQESIFAKEFALPHHFLFLNYSVKAKPFDNLWVNNASWVAAYDAQDMTMNKSTREVIDAYLQSVRS